MQSRIKYLLKFYLVTVLVFVMAKPVFMLCNHEGHSFTAADVWQVIIHGLSLDLSTAIYFVLLPLLLMVVSLWWKKWGFIRGILKVYAGVVAFAFALAFVSDTSLYPFWGFKLNASVLQYLSQPEGITNSVSAGYLLLRLVVFVIVLVIVYELLLPPRQVKPVMRKVAVGGTLGFLVSTPLLVIGIRGGVHESTTNIGQVYFSQNQFLNHSAVNPVFSFLSSFEYGDDDYYHYNYFSEEECDAILKDAYNTQSVLTDTLLANRPKQIVVILLESCGGAFTELCGRKDVMPNLNRLAKEGIHFTNCYGNTWRTDRGTVCTWSGYPSFPNTSVMKLPQKSRTLPSIAKTLQQQGYRTTYLYGGDINFTNMRSYLVSMGFERLIWMKDYTDKEQKTGKWGVRDDITFNTLYDLITHNPQPSTLNQLIGYSTLSSHEPWDVPVKKFDDEILNSFWYLDQCIGKFVERLKKSPQWNETLVVMLPDHAIDFKEYTETHPDRNRIPLIWLGGCIKQPFTVETICNQTDLAATLLGQLGLPHDDFTFSRDVLSKTYTRPFAVHNYNNAQSVIDSTGFTLYDYDAEHYIVKNSPQADALLRLNKAVLQKTTHDLKDR